MLVYFQKKPEEAEAYGVDLTSILISVGLAIAHAILECIQLNFEAKASKTSLANYCVACFNGKFGYVPFVDNMARIIKDEHASVDDFILDYDNITYTSRFVSTSVPFKFSDAGISTLCIRVNDLPKVEVTPSFRREFTLKLSTCIEDLAINDLHKIITICGHKTDLQIELSYEQFHDMI